MPREEGSAKQTQVMLLGEWCADDIASRLIEIDVKLEPPTLHYRAFFKDYYMYR